MISTTEFKKGIIIEIESQPWMVMDHQFFSPGKGSAFTRTKLKNIKTGKFVERVFKSNEQFEEIEAEYKKAVYLYSDHKNSVFLLKDDNQRIPLPSELTQNKVIYLKQNSEVELTYINEEIISLNIPIKVELKVVEAPPGFKGNTATGGLKKVKVETGLEIDTPLFIKEGDIIRINTETGEYSEKASQ